VTAGLHAVPLIAGATAASAAIVVGAWVSALLGHTKNWDGVRQLARRKQQQPPKPKPTRRKPN
jgi:hypothetical protein